MRKSKFPSPSQWPAHVIHSIADGEEVLTMGDGEMLVAMTEEVAAWALYALVREVMTQFESFVDVKARRTSLGWALRGAASPSHCNRDGVNGRASRAPARSIRGVRKALLD
jgi:hypothetical protein